jgi:hypothetical protein
MCGVSMGAILNRLIALQVVENRPLRGLFSTTEWLIFILFRVLAAAPL